MGWGGLGSGCSAQTRWDPQHPPWALQTLDKHHTLTTEDVELGKGCSTWGGAH